MEKQSTSGRLRYLRAIGGITSISLALNSSQTNIPYLSILIKKSMASIIDELLAEVEENIPSSNQLQSSISESAIGWHIEHIMLTIDRIVERLAQTDRRHYKWTFNLNRIFIFLTQTIPRGRAKSPKAVRPMGDISQEKLYQHLKDTRERLKTLDQLHPGQYFEHPYFGHLKLKKARRFLEIHTRHHVKIIRDIINAGRK